MWSLRQPWRGPWAPCSPVPSPHLEILIQGLGEAQDTGCLGRPGLAPLAWLKQGVTTLAQPKGSRVCW